jgi:SAM-dependent methyltransferase
VPQAADGVPSWLNAGWIERRSLRRALTGAGVYVRGVVVDMGCGDGRYRSLFERDARVYIGCDISAKSAADVRCNAEMLPFARDSIDTVVAVQVLDDLRQPARFFAGASDALKPGGHLLVTAPFFWRLHDLPNDYHRFTAPGLEALATEAGFEVVSLEPRGGFWATSGQMLSLYVWSLIGRGFFKPLASLVCGVIQLFAVGLDALHRDTRQTLGYTLVARKRADL